MLLQSEKLVYGGIGNSGLSMSMFGIHIIVKNNLVWFSRRFGCAMLFTLRGMQQVIHPGSDPPILHIMLFSLRFIYFDISSYVIYLCI